jgi:hypothetical protein
MQLALALALQAAQIAGAVGVEPVEFDLATHRPEGAGEGSLSLSCRSRDPSEVVVCARRGGGNGYPIDYWAKVFATTPLVAETGIAPNTSGARLYGAGGARQRPGEQARAGGGEAAVLS